MYNIPEPALNLNYVTSLTSITRLLPRKLGKVNQFALNNSNETGLLKKELLHEMTVRLLNDLIEYTQLYNLRILLYVYFETALH